MARKEGMKVDEDKQPRRRRGGSWEEARVGLLPITGLSQVKIIILQLFFYVATGFTLFPRRINKKTQLP